MRTEMNNFATEVEESEGRNFPTQETFQFFFYTFSDNEPSCNENHIEKEYLFANLFIRVVASFSRERENENKIQ